ncbi:MAG: hypothetical protein P1U57_04230 [Oleibacter sp.]|nr:hypothetical protein [Thalassolituus sp.]
MDIFALLEHRIDDTIAALNTSRYETQQMKQAISAAERDANTLRQNLIAREKQAREQHEQIEFLQSRIDELSKTNMRLTHEKHQADVKLQAMTEALANEGIYGFD